MDQMITVTKSGNGNDAAWSTGVTTKGGKFGNGVEINSTNENITASLSNVNPNIGTFTLWYKNTTTPDSYGNFFTSSKGDGQFALFRNNSNTSIGLQINLDTAIIWTGIQNIFDGGWHSLTLTYDINLSKYNLYIDAVNQGEQYNKFSPIDISSYNLLFGNEWDGSGEQIGGILDDFRIYNRSLSPSEVRQLYNWAPGPVGYWKLDENTGTSAFDSSGNGYTGSFTNNPIWKIGKIGNALNFTNTSNNGSTVTISDQDNLDLASDGNISVAAWIYRTADSRTDNGSSGTIVAKKASGGTGWYLATGDSDSGNANKIMFGVDGSEWGNSNTSITNNQWYHVEATIMTGKILTMYINGVIDSLYTLATPPATNSTNVTIGFGNTDGNQNNAFNGMIDDVKIYNYTRSQSQVVEDMNGSHPLGEVPLEANSSMQSWTNKMVVQ